MNKYLIGTPWSLESNEGLLAQAEDKESIEFLIDDLFGNNDKITFKRI